MKEPVGLSPPRLIVPRLLFVFIIKDRRAHFPPTLVLSQLLESSLEPNWLPPADVMADEWGFVKRSDAPYQSEWNEAFDSYHCSLFRRDPAYKSQHRLQRLFKSTQSQNELDASYEGLAERPR